MDDVFVVYAGFGEGHKRAALSAAKFLNSPCRDLLDFCPSFLRTLSCHGYLFVTTHVSFVWRILFFSTRNKFIRNLVDKFNSLIFASFIKHLKAARPRIVICTHFFPLSLVASIKQEYGIKIVSLITDIRVHPLWVHEGVDFYMGAMEETKDDLIDLGVAQSKISYGAIPLREGFLREPASGLREKFSLDHKPCLLFMSSLSGKLPFLKDLLQELTRTHNIFIIYGKNKKLKNYLDRLSSSSIISIKFHEDIWELMSLSEVIIAKPGGLTIFEGIYMRKAFVFTHYIPGQEKGNMDLLIKAGVARYARSPQELKQAIQILPSRSIEFSRQYPIALKDYRPVLTEIISRLR